MVLSILIRTHQECELLQRKGACSTRLVLRSLNTESKVNERNWWIQLMVITMLHPFFDLIYQFEYLNQSISYNKKNKNKGKEFICEQKHFSINTHTPVKGEFFVWIVLITGSITGYVTSFMTEAFACKLSGRFSSDFSVPSTTCLLLARNSAAAFVQ